MWYKYNDEVTHIVIYDDFSADVNTEDVDLVSQPFYSPYIFAKKVTSLFVLIQGFGFKILYAPTGRIYLKFDPFYVNKVWY